MNPIAFRMRGEPTPYALQSKCKYCKKALHYWNENAKYKKHLHESLKTVFTGPPIDGPIEMVTIIWFPMGKDPWNKPDADNMEKTIADACEKVLFSNDCRIVNNLIYKREGSADDYEIEIRIRPLMPLELRLPPILQGETYAQAPPQTH